jgi:D-inositol-3-phosphate glycosyltransferase
MKIILIGPAHPFRGGIASFNERLAREFRAQGHDVEIVSFTVQYPKLFFPGKTQYSDEPAPTDLIIHRWINSVNPISWLIAGWKIRKKKPDILISKFWIPLLGPALGSVLRCGSVRNKTTVLSVLDNVIPHEKRPGDTVFTRYFLNAVDGFVYMSDAVAKDLGSFNTTKPRVFCPHPLYDNFGNTVSRNEAANFLKLPENQKYILFFGVIRDYKGLDLLLEAYAESSNRSQAKLIVAGEFYNDKEKYLQIIESAKLSNDIHLFDSFIPDSQVKYFFSLANVVVQPYKSATQSGVTQIAYQFNCPMIVTNTGGLPEMVKHNHVGFVVNPEKQEIREAIDRFFNENKEEEFRSHVRIEKEKFSWTYFANQLLHLTGKK